MTKARTREEISRMLEEQRMGKMTVEEAGRKGGERTRETHDNEFFIRIGKKGGKAHAKNIRENGIPFQLHKRLSEAGRKGGEMTKNKHGIKFYQEIGKKGGSVPRFKQTKEE